VEARTFGMNKKIIALYIGISLIFLCTLGISPYPGSFIIKAIPAIILAIASLRNHDIPKIRYMVFGFLFSAVGDIFLELDRTNFFVHGLGSFLIAHIFYSIGLFTKKSSIKDHKRVASAMILFSMTMIFILSPKLGNLLIPVSLYILVISIMGVLSCGFLDNSPLVTLGASLFIISDSLIAVDKFLMPIPMAGIFIMVTYYAANFLIAYGFLNQRGRPL
jgi:uncharacterized membrane protein YhhN